MQIISGTGRGKSDPLRKRLFSSEKYLYRGLSIDVARNFLPKAEVMRIINGMAMFKMNKLHLHMSDDEGWRLEIPGLKELY